MASPCALCFLTMWWLSSKCQGPKGESQRKLYPFCGLVLQVSQCQFFLVLLFATAISSPGLMEGERESTSWWRSGKTLKEHVGPKLMLWPILENTVFYKDSWGCSSWGISSCGRDTKGRVGMQVSRAESRHKTWWWNVLFSSSLTKDVTGELDKKTGKEWY